MSSYNLQIGSTYDFDVYPVGIIGNNFKGVTVLALMDQQSAQSEIDTIAMHLNVYSHLPAGTPNNPKMYNYVKIKTTAGIITVLGLAWIKPETIRLVESKTAIITIAGINTDDVPRIRNALIQNGYNNIKIEIN